ncbi:hypothetical protein AGDE_15341 [Angomonas deanei]|uniref:Uncharacterized protein n=1 Tax=Angomonas deanei TaxID=59799 RepID=A0A7G2C761_9TRYP|nr:hypothetical protein AGDE_15341 [Angomonas deanei]CAD2215586.1 hypothetical protein, conserved [Angomonas deanei]|eukprot:EPY19245.1 hypothetical protein AGDE_15341 [Angomonas deanei]
MTLCQSVLTSPQKNNEKKEKEELAAICHKKTQLLDSVMRFGVSSITQTNSNNNTLQSLRKFNAVYRKMRHQEESEREEEKKSMKRKKTEQYLEETFFPSLSVLLYDHPENNNNPNNAPMSAEQRKLLEYTLQRVTYNKETHLQEWKKRTEPPTTHNNNNNTKVDPTTPSNTIPNPKQNVAHPHTANPPPLQNNNNTSNNYYQNASAKKATEPTPTSLNYYQNTPANHNPPSPSTVAPKPVMKSVLNPNATPYRYSDNNSNNNNSVFNTSNEEAWDSSGIIDTPSHNNNTSGGSILQTPSPSPPILTKQQLREQRFGTASPSHSRPVIPTGGSILHTSSGSSMGRPTGSVLASTNDTNSNNNHSRGVLGRGQSQGGHRGRGRGGRRGH